MPGMPPILPLPAPPSDSEEVTSEKQPSSSSESVDSTSVAGVATHTGTIGIIHPPPDVRTIVDKTAQFVAKNGLDFEKRVLTENTRKAKFSFWSRLDPYHAYYQHRISELRTQLRSSAQQTIPSQQRPADSAAGGKEEVAKPDDASALFKLPVRKVVEPPEAEQCTVLLPERITGEDWISSRSQSSLWRSMESRS